MSTTKNSKKKKISSTLLNSPDHESIGRLQKETGASESVLLRGLIRYGLSEWGKRKISTLALMKLGAYSSNDPN